MRVTFNIACYTSVKHPAAVPISLDSLSTRNCYDERFHSLSHHFTYTVLHFTTIRPFYTLNSSWHTDASFVYIHTGRVYVRYNLSLFHLFQRPWRTKSHLIGLGFCVHWRWHIFTIIRNLTHSVIPVYFKSCNTRFISKYISHQL